MGFPPISCHLKFQQKPQRTFQSNDGLGHHLGKPKSISGPKVNDLPMNKRTTSNCHMQTPQFKTVRNNLKCFQTASNKFIQLRKPLKMVCTKTISISRCCMSSKMQNNVQHLINSTFQLTNPLKLIGIDAKTATSSDTTKQSPQIHICRQHIQMLRPKQLFFISNSDLKVPFCSKSSSENQCSYQTASIQLKTSQFWGKPKP